MYPHLMQLSFICPPVSSSSLSPQQQSSSFLPIMEYIGETLSYREDNFEHRFYGRYRSWHLSFILRNLASSNVKIDLDLLHRVHLECLSQKQLKERKVNQDFLMPIAYCEKFHNRKCVFASMIHLITYLCTFYIVIIQCWKLTYFFVTAL